MNPDKVVEFVTDLLSPAMHFKRARSIGLATVGAMHARQLSICEVGRAMARVREMSPKHGIKQVDRLLSNRKFDVQKVFAQTVPWLVADRKEIVVSLDWTEYADDGHSRITANLVTRHGRATPLVWKTVETRRLKGRRNRHEDELLYLLDQVLPAGVHVILVADRGFGDTKLFEFLRDDLGWDFVIRIRGNIVVEDPATGEVATAVDWVPSNGRIREIPEAHITTKRFKLGVVCVKERGMKQAWCLAATLAGQKQRVVKLYGRRFTCEENYRDEKDPRFGFGILNTTLGTPERRDRFLIIAMLAMILLTLLGGAGEQLGCDRQLKANTTSRRTHSLLRQGREYILGTVARFANELRATFEYLLRNHTHETATYALI